MLHAFLLTQSGIPVLYSGDEIGQLNDYSYHEDPLKKDDSRYLHRGKFDWNLAAMRKDPSTRQGMLFERLMQLIELRQSHRVFDAHADTWVLEPYNDSILALGRYYEGEKLLALFNFSENDQTAWLNEPEVYTDLLTGEETRAEAVAMKPHEFRWLLKTYPSETD